MLMTNQRMSMVMLFAVTMWSRVDCSRHINAFWVNIFQCFAYNICILPCFGGYLANLYSFGLVFQGSRIGCQHSRDVILGSSYLAFLFLYLFSLLMKFFYADQKKKLMHDRGSGM